METFDQLIKEAEKNIISKLESKGVDIGVKESLQRTPEWYKDREGEFTGSEISKLMGVDRSFSKIEWGRPEKLVAFNETAKKYIFGKAKERQRNKVLKRSIGKNGEYGETAEKIVFELLKEKYPDYKFEGVGFIEFIKDIAGASPDGLINYDMGLEIKLATTWDTLYLREQFKVDHTHQDFWQIQTEMLALKVKKCMYVVAEPPEYLEDMNIDDLSIQYVKASPIHQQAIIQRCHIGNDAIFRYLAGTEFHEAVRQACTEYETPGNTCNNECLTEKAAKQDKLEQIDTLVSRSGKPKIDIPF